MLKNFVEIILDFFYPPFSRVIDRQTFRYLICGGGNTLLGLVIFYVCHKFIFNEQDVNLAGVPFKSYSAAYFISFLITFPIGFLLSRYVVWQQSNLRGRVQLFRYFLLVMACFVVNYVCLKLFVELLHIWPTVSQVLSTLIVISFSYLTQKHFSFKVRQA